jgi:hypothetical protein
MTIISSQRYLDENIVAEKIADADFEVMLSPALEIDGETYQVILDGHHSFAAAKQAGVTPAFWTADCGDHDAIGLLENSNPDDFLLAVHMGSDYYNAETGKDIW